MSSNTLFVYGTLRAGGDTPTVKIPGAKMFVLGWYPGVVFEGTGEIVCEKREVTDWASVDRYEGFDESSPETSLYIRRPITVDGEEGFIYEYNRQVEGRPEIVSGDWLKYTNEKKGVNHGLLQ